MVEPPGGCVFYGFSGKPRLDRVSLVNFRFFFLIFIYIYFPSFFTPMAPYLTGSTWANLIPDDY